MRSSALPRVALLVSAVAGACSPPPPRPEDVDGGSLDGSSRDGSGADARRDGSAPGRGAAGAPCDADGDCAAGMRCLDSLSVEGAKYCAPSCSARADCDPFGHTSYYLPVPYANDYGVDHFTRGYACAEAPGAAEGSQKYCQFACGNNQFVNFSADGAASCNCLPDFERHRDSGRAYCTYNPQDECSFFRDCVGTPQCGVLTCAISRGLRGACFNTTGGDPRSYVDCILGSVECDSGCIENCLSSGGGSCDSVCCHERPPVAPSDAGVPDAGAPDVGAPDAGPVGAPDLRIQRASWFIYRPVAGDERLSVCLNANRDGTANSQGHSIVVANVGTGRSPASQVGVGVVGPDGVFHYLSPPDVPALDPGQTYSINGPLCVHGMLALSALPAGTYRAQTWADVENNISESDESNNVSSGTYMFTVAPPDPGACRTCATNADCAAGATCLTRRCDGRRACYATTDANCSTVDGAACPSSPLWGACTGDTDSSCGPTASCARFSGGMARHCAHRCTTDDDCTASPDAAFDGRSQYCATSDLCVMRCSGAGDRCPGATQCLETSTPGTFICK